MYFKDEKDLQLKLTQVVSDSVQITNLKKHVDDTTYRQTYEISLNMSLSLELMQDFNGSSDPQRMREKVFGEVIVRKLGDEHRNLARKALDSQKQFEDMETWAKNLAADIKDAND